MHSQAKLVKHLKAIRNLIVNQHILYEHDTANRSELGLCDANIRAWGGSNTDMKDAVKEMIRAQFDVVGVKHDESTYLYPIRTGFSPAANARGTLEEVAAGYAARLRTLDGWIANAEHKLLIAAFRTALDQVCKAGTMQYMCNELKQAAALLTGDDSGKGYAGELARKAQDVLDQYKPYDLKSNVWFKTDDRGRAIRKAILNLCITELVRGPV